MMKAVTTMAVLRFAVLATLFGARTVTSQTLNCKRQFRVTGSSGEQIRLPKTFARGQLCQLALKNKHNGALIPVARSYDGHDWEPSGSGISSSKDLRYWRCNRGSCAANLPAGSYVVLQSVVERNEIRRNEQARFLETATFGPNADTLDKWEYPTFAHFIKQQVSIRPTFHRTFFRLSMSPEWKTNKIQFGSNLDPCQRWSRTWSRQALSAWDTNKEVLFRKVNGMWVVSVDGNVRTVIPRLRYHGGPGGPGADVRLESGKSYRYCTSRFHARSDIHYLFVQGRCHRVYSGDLQINFPGGFEPPSVLRVTLPRLDDGNEWAKRPGSVFYKRNETQPSACNGLPEWKMGGPQAHAKTRDGKWIRYAPRLIVRRNTISKPMVDGGLGPFKSGEVRLCANVPRTFQNEDSCFMSWVPACEPGAKSAVGRVGQIVCGSPDEELNSAWRGDGGLDIATITMRGQSTRFHLPLDRTPSFEIDQQKQFIWNKIALTAPDQLRQRMAWALFYMFAVPESTLFRATEPWLQYYDIFVRHAFGNYRDILKEIAFNPLMARSLTYMGSRSVGEEFRRFGRIVQPDENFAVSVYNTTSSRTWFVQVEKSN